MLRVRIAAPRPHKPTAAALRRGAAGIGLAMMIIACGGCARDNGGDWAETNLMTPKLPPPAAGSSDPSSPVVYENSPGKPAGPAKLKALDIVGRWGFASYLRPEDRDRTIAAAEKTCNQPYLIGQGAGGGVVMHLADQRDAQELAIKGSTEGHDYIGPEGPAGGEQDREVQGFDGRVLTLNFVSPEISGRYGTQIFVRCTDELPPVPATSAEAKLQKTSKPAKKPAAPATTATTPNPATAKPAAVKPKPDNTVTSEAIKVADAKPKKLKPAQKTLDPASPGSANTPAAD